MSIFDNLPSEGDTWGLLFNIPTDTAGSATGFGFVNTGNGNYTGFSVYHDGAANTTTTDNTWLCDST